MVLPEACDWAQMLVRLYTRWAERHGFQVELVDELRNDEAGIRNATLRVIGDYAYGYLQGETGVHRLSAHQSVRFQRPPAHLLRRRGCDAGNRRGRFRSN